MARTVNEIKKTILDAFAANPYLVYVDNQGITRNITDNTSMYALFDAFAFCIAMAIGIVEQLMDKYVEVIEAIVGRSAAASATWLQARMFQFQYSATNPQIVSLISGIPQYPAVDETLQIIDACAISVDVRNNVNIKCATGSPLAALDAQQIAAAQSYVNLIGVDGINYVIISQAPDRIYIDATIYYNGMYSSTMLQTVIDTVTAYFQQLSVDRFDGTLLMSDIERLIRSITGVNDVVLNNIKARKFDVVYASATPLIANTATLQRSYNSVAGYMIPEDTATHTLTESLTLIAQ
jgi:hypothetical protein